MPPQRSHVKHSLGIVFGALCLSYAGYIIFAGGQQAGDFVKPVLQSSVQNSDGTSAGGNSADAGPSVVDADKAWSEELRSTENGVSAPMVTTDSDDNPARYTRGTETGLFIGEFLDPESAITTASYEDPIIIGEFVDPESGLVE